MKTKPILFNTEMVRAILDGRKSVTRRVVKPQPMAVYHDGTVYYDNDCPVVIVEGESGCCEQITAPYSHGDTLYVRETWNREPYQYDNFIYRADGCYGPDMPWRSSIHMPKEAARLFLRVTDVRVEKLQDITPEDVESEGVHWVNNPIIRLGVKTWTSESKRRFARLWDGTIKKADLPLYGWDANPWIWVIEFERCEKPSGI